jgi:hypothetical protein
MSYEAAVSRDYPVVFGSLFIFTLFGLLIKLIGDLSTLVDRVSTSPRGTPDVQAFAVGPPPLRNASRKPPWLVVAVAVHRPVHADPGRRTDRQRQAVGLSYQGQLFPVSSATPSSEFGGQLPFQADYRSDYVQNLIKKDGGWLLFPPIPFSDDTPNYDLNQPARARPRRELAGHRRPGAGRVGAGDFRRTGVDPVCLDADRRQRTDRHRRRRPARLLRRLGRPVGSACWRSGPGCRCCTC